MQKDAKAVGYKSRCIRTASLAKRPGASAGGACERRSDGPTCDELVIDVRRASSSATRRNLCAKRSAAAAAISNTETRNSRDVSM